MKKLSFVKLVFAAAVSSTVAFGGFYSESALAAAPMAKLGAPGFFRFTLGDFEVTALSDGTVDLPVDKLLQQAPEKTKKELAELYLGVPTETSVNAYLINTGSKLILIDGGAGGLFGPTLGKLVANLNASGYKVSDVDEIYITHMHPDHVGGLAQDGKLAFPNAIVRADERESSFWLSETNLAHAPDSSKGFFQGAMVSLKPYVEAHHYQPFASNTVLTPGITSNSSYGHTEGHTSYVVESHGKKMIILGDLIHVQAVQFGHPKVTIGFDSTPKEAMASRFRVFDEAAKEGDLVAAAHIAFPGIGHLRTVGKGSEKSYQWIPVNYTQPR
ncbi:MBL fold metallo-hydrolase [Undibacterium sp. SXout20W]|uniref:MBL fold metallo-hydrolase n=1 Tax=Undibacterium sp. SXout20W TaxID=3413051 RepID=UPI003BF0269F